MVALSPRLGEDSRVRSVVGERVPEYGVLVSPDYAGVRVLTGVYERRRPGTIVGIHFESWLRGQGPPPPPQRVRPSKSPPNEFIVPLDMEGIHRLAVVRPHIAIGSHDSLQGDRLRNPVTHLQALLNSVQSPHMLQTLRLDAFSHLNSTVFCRHALLMSMLHAMLTGRVTPLLSIEGDTA